MKRQLRYLVAHGASCIVCMAHSWRAFREPEEHNALSPCTRESIYSVWAYNKREAVAIAKIQFASREQRTLLQGGVSCRSVASRTPGPYDGRAGAVNIYTHPWTTETMRAESTLTGSIYVFWREENRIWQLEIDEEFSFDDLLVELGTLEEKALGQTVHGRSGPHGGL